MLHVKAFSLQFTHEFKERRNGMLHNFAKSTLKLHRKKRKVNKNTNTEPNKKIANSLFSSHTTSNWHWKHHSISECSQFLVALVLSAINQHWYSHVVAIRNREMYQLILMKASEMFGCCNADVIELETQDKYVTEWPAECREFECWWGRKIWRKDIIGRKEENGA